MLNLLLLGRIRTTVLAVGHLEVGIVRLRPNVFNGLGSVADSAAGKTTSQLKCACDVASLLTTYKLTKAAFLGGRKLICSISVSDKGKD